MQIIESKVENGNRWIKAIVKGTTQAQCFISPNYVQVCVMNASNKAYRGAGRCFSNVFEAISAYKSQAVKDMIKHCATI
jgi:hypothetical protein